MATGFQPSSYTFYPTGQVVPDAVVQYSTIVVNVLGGTTQFNYTVYANQADLEAGIVLAVGSFNIANTVLQTDINNILNDVISQAISAKDSSGSIINAASATTF